MSPSQPKSPHPKKKDHRFVGLIGHEQRGVQRGGLAEPGTLQRGTDALFVGLQ
jgi:hypothetical protein